MKHLPFVEVDERRKGMLFFGARSKQLPRFELGQSSTLLNPSSIDDLVGQPNTNRFGRSTQTVGILNPNLHPIVYHATVISDTPKVGPARQQIPNNNEVATTVLRDGSHEHANPHRRMLMERVDGDGPVARRKIGW